MRGVARRSLLKRQRATFVSRGRGTVGKTTVGEHLLAKPKSSICIIRKVGGIGDVLMLTPVLREIKRQYPDCHLTFAIDMHSTGNNVYYELVKNAPFVDEFVDARYVQHGKYDCTWDASAVCLRYERQGLPAINRIDLFARAAGINLVSKRPFYQVEEQERIRATHAIAGRTTVLLHTASNEDKRCWPIEKYVELVQEMDSLSIVFLVMDFNGKHHGWNKKSNCIDISNCSIRELGAYIEQVDLFVGPDSGPMHMAGALGTRSIVLFGSIPPEARINYYTEHQAITADLTCLGCWYAKCPYDVKCMKDIEVQRVLQIIKEVVGETESSAKETNCKA